MSEIIHSTQVVVAAAIVRDGVVLAARRSAPVELAGGWEFPGGKVEPAESHRAALVRECQEELGILVVAGALLGVSEIRPGLSLELYACSSEDEPALLQDHDELRWLAPSDLDAVAWLSADLPLLPAVRAVLLA